MNDFVPSDGPATRGDSTRRETWARRALSIPAVGAGAAIALGTAPVWIPLAALVDVFRRPRTALRCGLAATLYLVCEALGLLASAVLWLVCAGGRGARRERYERWNFALQCLWAGALFHGAARLFGLRLITEGGEAVQEPPLLLLLRHTSLADTLLPAVLVSRPHRIRLRYVLKRELLWDPCLDVVGQRLPNYFARRDSGDSERERRGVAALARDLGPREGVLIYPEGTRFSPQKRERALERLSRGGSSVLLDRARRLERVLPPRLGGPLALLEASPGTDVVFGVHVGLDAARNAADLWNGALLRSTIRVRFWRVTARDIPIGEQARAEWLYEQWARVDRAVAEMEGTA